MLLAVAAACGSETIEVPGETVIVEKEVIKEVQVPGETVVVEKEVVKTVEVPGPERVVVKEVPGKNYVTDPVFGTVVSAPEYGRTITTGTAFFPAFKDPYTDWAQRISGTVAEKLGMVDWAIDRDTYPFVGSYPAPLYALKGALAESWAQPDDKTIVVKVRQGVNWHNKAPINGREMTADDVVYNFQRMLGLGKFTDAGPSPAASVRTLNSMPWESVTATDKWTVVFKLKEPTLSALVNILDSHNMYIQGPEVLEQSGDWDWRNLVGTGPFMLTDVVEGTSYSYTKNPDYWGYDEKYPENRLPYIDEIEYIIVPEKAALAAALRTGKTAMAGGKNLTLPQSKGLIRSNPELVAWKVSGTAATVFGFYGGRPPFDDKNVRIAMQKAINLEELNFAYFEGDGDPTPWGHAGEVTGMMVPYAEWPEEVKWQYEYDPAEAERLLDEAGYPRGDDGIRFEAGWDIAPAEGMDLDLATLVTSYWDKIGVDVTVEHIADLTVNRTRREQALHGGMTGGPPRHRICCDFVMGAAGAYYGDPAPGTGITDPVFNDLIDSIRAATTEEEYIRLNKEGDMRAITELWSGYTPLALLYMLHQPWLKNYRGEAGGSIEEYTDILSFLWIDQELKEEMGH